MRPLGSRHPALVAVAVLAMASATALTTSAGASAAGAGTLALSAAEIATGQVLSVSGDGCVSDTLTERSIRSFLLIGEPGSQVLAGFVEGADGSPAPIGVPGWIDTNASAEVHASCIERGADGVAQVGFTYEPLGIDVVPGTGPAPVAAPDRTELAQGQATSVAISDCDPAAGGQLEGVVFAGSDPSGQSWGDPVAVADLSDDSTSLVVGPFTLDGQPLEPGPYVLVAGCGTDAAGFVAAPIQLTVTANDAVGTAAVASATDRRTLEATGTGCFAGEVSVTLVAIPPGVLPARAPAARLGQARSVGDATTVTVTPDADGSWSASWTPSLLEGQVLLDARCGDPLADGFAYAPTGADFQLVPPPPPSVTTTPPRILRPGTPAPPAVPVSGSVSYAG